MLKKIIDFFTGKKPAPEVIAPGGAPYKVPEPAATTPIPDIPSVAVPIPYRFQSPAIETTNTPPVAVLIPPEPIAAIPIPLTPANEPPKCGCGRSSTGFCVGLHKLSPEAWADHPNNPATVGKIVAEPARPEKKKRTFVKKPAEPKAVAKPKPAAIKAPAKPRAKKTPQ